MTEFSSKGRYRARLAVVPADFVAAQRLRHRCFVERAGRPDRPDRRETDGFDAACRHVLVEEVGTGALAACFRVMTLASGAGIGASYSAQTYDLGGFAAYDRPMLELGRFCIRPDLRDGDVLRLAWGALARMVDEAAAGMLFGCSSFIGAQPEDHAAAFALLARDHLGPLHWRPGIRTADVVRLSDMDAAGADRSAGLQQMPSLLRSYLGMGGWVSDHAVIDRDLDTMHVFTALDITRIPPTRVQALRKLCT